MIEIEGLINAEHFIRCCGARVGWQRERDRERQRDRDKERDRVKDRDRERQIKRESMRCENVP